MKKNILIVALVLLLALTAIGGSLAYFTDTKTETNTFTMGNVTIALTEEHWDEPTNVAPGVTYEKDPVVTNTGANAAYIRVDVTLSDAAAFTAAAAAHNIEDLSTVFTVASDFDTYWTMAEVSSDTTADTLTYGYYYNTPLESGENTGALFTAVTIPAAFTSAEMAAIGENFTIQITAHAIQTDTFASVTEAFAAYPD